MIHTTSDFYNKVATEIKNTYSTDAYNKSRYDIELFNNGCLNYRKLIGRLAKSCNDTTKNIHAIVEKYIISFGCYTYKPKQFLNN